MIIVTIHRKHDGVSGVGMEDPRLSWKAKGILAYLLEKGSHQTSREDIIKASLDGTLSFTRGVIELKKEGYLVGETTRHNGLITGIKWNVHEEPLTGCPLTGVP